MLLRCKAEDMGWCFHMVISSFYFQKYCNVPWYLYFFEIFDIIEQKFGYGMKFLFNSLINTRYRKYRLRRKYRKYGYHTYT